MQLEQTICRAGDACASVQGTPLGRAVGSQNISDFTQAAPSSRQGIIGYHFLKGVISAAQLTPLSEIDTSDVSKSLEQQDEVLKLNVTASGQVSLRPVDG